MADRELWYASGGPLLYDDTEIATLWYPAPYDVLPFRAALLSQAYVTDTPVNDIEVVRKIDLDNATLFELNPDTDIQPKIRLGVAGGHYNIVPTLQTSGLLTVGVIYKILDWITNDDFVNVGGANVDGTVFVATGTTPTHWAHLSKLVGYQSLGSTVLPWDKIYVTNVYAVGVNVSGLTASVPVITDGSKNLVSIAYTGGSSFRKNLGLETDDSPTFNQVNATTLHTTTILADHVGEHGSAHGVVFDNDLLRVGKLSIDHIAEATSAHAIVFDNDLLRVGKLSIDHVAEASSAHTIVFDNTVTIGSLEGILKAAAGVVAVATIGTSLSYSAPTLDAIQDIRTVATPQFAAVRLSDTDASHYLALIFNQAETVASRTLYFILGLADRTITLSGSPTLGDWFDQAVKEASGPSFDHLHLTIAGGTAPLSITSNTMCSNLNADLLDGKHASEFWGGGASVDHALLSTIHSDTLAASAVLGDIIHGNVTPVWARLAGNTAATKKFLVQTGTGLISAVPAWDTIVDGDVPATHSGTAHHAVVTLATAGDTLLGLAGQALDLDTQAANLGFFGPVSGEVAIPTFRAMVAADLGTTLTPTFAGIVIPDAGTIGLGSGKGLIQFDDETTDFVSFMNCKVGIGIATPTLGMLQLVAPSGPSQVRLGGNTGPGFFYASEPGAAFEMSLGRDGTAGTFPNTAIAAAVVSLNGNASGSYIVFRTAVAVNTNPPNRVMIASGGKVGINDDDPGEFLDVNGNINATGVLKIDDVQVVSNRVIDAKADDAINAAAWDATTAGVLTALRDAMITHGLIAASA